MLRHQNSSLFRCYIVFLLHHSEERIFFAFKFLHHCRNSFHHFLIVLHQDCLDLSFYIGVVVVVVRSRRIIITSSRSWSWCWCSTACSGQRISILIRRRGSRSRG